MSDQSDKGTLQIYAECEDSPGKWVDEFFVKYPDCNIPRETLGLWFQYAMDAAFMVRHERNERCGYPWPHICTPGVCKHLTRQTDD